MKKVKFANFLVLFLAMVICVVCVNFVVIVPDVSGSGGGTVDKPTDWPDNPDNPDNPGTVVPPDGGGSTTDAKYKAGDGYKAWTNAYTNFNNSTSFKSTMSGTNAYAILTGYKGTVTASRTKYANNNFWVKTSSKGNIGITVYQETFCQDNNKQVTIFAGDNQNNAKKEAPMSYKMYIQEVGMLPTGLQYNVTKDNFSEVSMTTLSNGSVKIYAKLDLKTSVERYENNVYYVANEVVKKLPALGKVSMPTFTKVEIEFVVDKNDNLVSIRYIDEYYFSKPAKIHGSSDLTETFKYEYVIPKVPSWL